MPQEAVKPFYKRHDEYLRNQHETGLPPVGLTFEDTLILPAHSTIPSRKDGSISLLSHIAVDVYVNSPIMTSNMDTITEWRMAERVALLGGVGVIHRYLTSDEQARQVKLVKDRTRTFQDRPFSVYPEATIKDMRKLQKDHKTGYFLVQDLENNLLGIVTDRDLESTDDHHTQAFNIMTPRDQLVTVPEGTTPEEAENVMKVYRKQKVPVLSADGKVVGVYTRKDFELAKKYPSASRDKKGKLIVGAAVGVKDADAETERAYKLVDAGVDFLIIDIAHGDSENMMKMLKRLTKDKYINVPVIAGNIATGEAAEALIGEGADGLKVGIGPGWACDTRVVAGVGRAQLSAIASVAAVAVGKNIAVIADGGMRNPGDLVKALVAGADIGMFGGMFAGTEETPGIIIKRGNKKYKRYVGMASREARKRAKYAQQPVQTIGLYEDRFSDQDAEDEEPAPEGREKEIPFRGPATDVFKFIEGGVRSGMSYIDAKTIPEIREKGELERITQAGATEQYGDIS
ncbi:MAG: inosine-5''-monophosphate dehydrogenase, IMP dehydrogenase [Candidatus Gottesmanbacteria bacterium GW2011_GWA2_43_14]|uniref:Inosine-5''-monophosphate dehydrogenase, IMP dehydrogenase n=1 Tax=Candidatus Gottesmanbacteria bacterium GW2011_GWA2_43_14 TaxID=1618443 RepID=A0A0G1DJ40_9BACT|nr:MAG: inosine-5''-monophosphate dehydrogenase, IMP dehydrogenase [Candidatus Gottesmanbacteria bacterium GW2011_GWA2_43_14]